MHHLSRRCGHDSLPLPIINAHPDVRKSAPISFRPAVLALCPPVAGVPCVSQSVHVQPWARVDMVSGFSLEGEVGSSRDDYMTPLQPQPACDFPNIQLVRFGFEFQLHLLPLWLPCAGVFAPRFVPERSPAGACRGRI